MRSLITASRLMRPAAPQQTGNSGAGQAEPAEGPWLLLENGMIAAIGAGSRMNLPSHDTHMDYPDATLCPAFIDIHIHGAVGHDVMEGTPAALDAVGGFLATRGVGAYFPTTVTAPVDDTLRALTGLAQMVKHRVGGDPSAARMAATPLGIHLEGPFVSHEKRGVHPPDCIQRPSVDLFDRFWEASEGMILLMTIAPELEGAIELIEHATKLGVRISLGHSNAHTAEAKAGIDAGARSATHTFNAMRALDHRDPGILGTVLDTESLYAELICDGIHVDPALVRLFWKAVGRDRGILITDGMSATGMPDGEYMLGGFAVQVKDGRCMHDGHLAGSVLTLDRAVQNFVGFTKASLPDALGLVTTNPATLTGVEAKYGALVVGGIADLNVLRANGEVLATYLGGQLVGATA